PLGRGFFESLPISPNLFAQILRRQNELRPTRGRSANLLLSMNNVHGEMCFRAPVTSQLQPIDVAQSHNAPVMSLWHKASSCTAGRPLGRLAGPGVPAWSRDPALAAGMRR